MASERAERVDIVDLVQPGSPRFEAAVAFVLDPHGHRLPPHDGQDEQARWLVRHITRRATLDEAVRFLESEDHTRLYRRYDEHRWVAQTVRLLVGRDPVPRPKYLAVDCPGCGVLAGTRCGRGGEPFGWYCAGRQLRAERAGVYRRSWA